MKREFIDKGLKFDIIIDDGPHTLDSMIFFTYHFPQLLTDDGILVVEDVQHIEWIDSLTRNTPPTLRSKIEVADLRPLKNRWDDILFMIDKSKTD